MELIKAEDVTSFLTFRHFLSNLKTFKYPYTISFKRKNVNFKEAKENVLEKLKIAVKKKIDNSEKPAIMMSSGIDSVFLAALMKELAPEKKIRAYTAMFASDHEYLESIKRAKYLGLEHKIIEINRSDYLVEDRYLTPLILRKKEPLHPNEIALAKAESISKDDGCDMVFCGEGADDIFGGYSNNFTFYKNWNGRDFFHDFLETYRYFSLDERKRIINPEFLIDDLELLKEYLGEHDIGIENLAIYFTQKIHTPGLLKRGYNAIASNGLEKAFPYMNSELVSYVNSLPFEYKIFSNISKYILREIACMFVPKNFAYTEKHPFPVTFNTWMKDINNWNLNDKLFLTKNISKFNGWNKWMLINLNRWSINMVK